MTYQPPPGWYQNEPQWYAEPPAAQDRGRSLRIAALILVPLIVVAAVVTGVVILKRQSGVDPTTGPVRGQLRGTYPTKPQVGWRLSVDEVMPNASVDHPQWVGAESTDPTFLNLGPVLVAKVLATNSDRSAELVGIDAVTGKVVWRNDNAGFNPICATEAINDLLPCLGAVSTFGPGPGEGLKVSFIRLSDGPIDHKLPAPDRAYTLLVRGSAIYTVGNYSKGLELVRGTAADLTADWQRAYALDEEHCDGQGDAFYGADDDLVYAGSDTAMVVIDVRTGERYGERTTDPVLFPGKGFAAYGCDAEDNGAWNSVEVYDDSGKHLRSLTTDGDRYLVDPWLVADADRVPLIVGDTAYDFQSGQQLWKTPGGRTLRRIVGNVVIGFEPDGLVGLDRATGVLMWRAAVSSEYFPVIEASDGQRVLVDDQGLTSIDLDSGQREWAIDVGGRIAAAGEGFATGTSDTITYYPPTGGPSVAPGTAQVPALEADPAGGPITKCGTEPELKPVEYRAENGGLVVKMEFKATCSSGDIIAGDRFRVTIRDGESMIASGTFDFSDDPLVLGGAGSPPTIVDLTFSEGTIWRLPNTLGVRDAGGSGEIVTTAKASGNELVDCEDEGGDSGPASVDQQPQAPRSPKVTVGGDAPCSDGEALAALRVQVDSDRPFVQAGLADRWVAQLSAKQPGLVAAEVDGRMVTWTPCEILRQHLRMRLQYPEVRLVWSDEWRTFDLRGWWVTIAGVTFPDPDAANGWCDQRSIAVTECFAKVVSNSRDSRGGTKYRR
ncbi:MAG: PQQ-binding-like beta-propeller repeat protein [Mycobacterium sp.]